MVKQGSRTQGKVTGFTKLAMFVEEFARKFLSAVLYTYVTPTLASSCSWRVRAALHHKQIPYVERNVDIVRSKEQLTEQYKSINPAQKVPALHIDGHVLVESMAILQYLEDTRPERSLSPDTPLLRARMREICETIVSGIQPLQNIGIRPRFSSDEEHQSFCLYHVYRGLETLETLLSRSAGDYCVGNTLTMADLCLVPQIYNAELRMMVDITKYETIYRLYKKLMLEEPFVATHPRNAAPKLSKL